VQRLDAPRLPQRRRAEGGGEGEQHGDDAHPG
jgi:hypothetical protein